MSDKTVARRYAQALFELGREMKKLDEIEKDLSLVTGIINTDEKLKRVVEHQLIVPEKKANIFKKLFAGKIDSFTLKFLLLVIHKKRESYLQGIYEQFLENFNEYRGIEEAFVTSAVELTGDIQEALKEKLQKFTGKKIRLTTNVSPEIIGGLKVRIGDRVIDGSVKTRLDLLYKHLQETELAK